MTKPGTTLSKDDIINIMLSSPDPDNAPKSVPAMGDQVTKLQAWQSLIVAGHG
jgi:hypothetical protein